MPCASACNQPCILPASSPTATYPLSHAQLSAGAQEARLSLGGLSNEAGEYNCFLNAIIQCLWHCRDICQQVRRPAA